MLTFSMFWLVFALGVGFLARHRGRSAVNWFLISVVVSPLLGLALVMMIKDLALADALDTVTQDIALTHVNCPHCYEYVLPDASVCMYCRNAITPQPDFATQRLAQKLDETKNAQVRKQSNVVIGMFLFVGFCLIVWLSTHLK